jgi:hypothetical protein
MHYNKKRGKISGFFWLVPELAGEILELIPDLPEGFDELFGVDRGRGLEPELLLDPPPGPGQGYAFLKIFCPDPVRPG